MRDDDRRAGDAEENLDAYDELLDRVRQVGDEAAELADDVEQTRQDAREAVEQMDEVTDGDDIKSPSADQPYDGVNAVESVDRHGTAGVPGEPIDFEPESVSTDEVADRMDAVEDRTDEVIEQGTAYLQDHYDMGDVLEEMGYGSPREMPRSEKDDLQQAFAQEVAGALGVKESRARLAANEFIQSYDGDPDYNIQI